MSVHLIGVDTNILVRYLMRDHEAQAKCVDRLVASTGPGCALFVNPVVVTETIWVLENVFKVPASEARRGCCLLLQTPEFDAPSKLSVGDYENWFAMPECGFADVLIAEINHSSGCSVTKTFDKNAAKNIPSMELLT